MCCCENKLICTCETLRCLKIFYGRSVGTVLTVGKKHMTEKSGIMIGLLHQPKKEKQSSEEHEDYILWDVPSKHSMKKKIK